MHNTLMQQRPGTRVGYPLIPTEQIPTVQNSQHKQKLKQAQCPFAYRKKTKKNGKSGENGGQ